MCRGDKEGLRRKDVEQLVKTFRPATTSVELEQKVGPVKGRITYNDVRHILLSEPLPKVCGVLECLRPFQCGKEETIQ
jgi:hypothetical protein